MDVEVKNKANRRHVGHNLQKIRVWYEAGGFSG